jgi:hypothetical protein
MGAHGLRPALVAATLLLAGCSARTEVPSQAARMVCEQEAQNDIAIRIGVTVNQPVVPLWSDDAYSCRYSYPSGSFVLSVKEFPDLAGATTYLDSVRVPRTAVSGLGDAAFTVSDGSVFVRKDTKVLHVDAGALPDPFGRPPVSRAEVARGIATVIMGCWSGD